jgi:hypothetical protein
MGRLRLAGRGWSAGCGFAARLEGTSFGSDGEAFVMKRFRFG